MIRLTIELVPATCWYSNVRSEVSRPIWEKLRQVTLAKAEHRCEVCGASKVRLDCHEVWQYDDLNRIQLLERLCALCVPCHEVKHIGLANIRGNGPRATKHLAKVNGWTVPQAMRYISAQFEIWQHRSQFEWKLDLECLREHGVQVDQLKAKAVRSRKRG